MTIGERIRAIRTFRGITQRELGMKLGYEDKYADTRISQYEKDYRVPKKDTIMEMAKIFDCNYKCLENYSLSTAEDIMETLFWLDEANMDAVHLFEMIRANNMIAPKTYGEYCTEDFQSATPPVGISLDYGLVNDFLQNWLKIQNKYKSKEISRDEYFEWKIQWPSSASK